MTLDAELRGALQCLRNARRNAEHEGITDYRDVQREIADVELTLQAIRVRLLEKK